MVKNMLRRSNTQTRAEHRLDFERARFEYCAQLFGNEEKRKETLEKKGQFYLSFVTIFLGAVFLKLDRLNSVKDILGKGNLVLLGKFSMYFLLTVLLLSIIAALISVLKCMQIREYSRGCPKSLEDSIFIDLAPTVGRDNESFFKERAIDYAIALEINRKINSNKATWLNVCSYCSFTGVLSLLVLVIVVGLGTII